MITIDTETCGLHGMPVLLQFAKDDGPVILWNIWKESVVNTLQLIEKICEEEVIFFNGAFDWFMLYKLYTTWSLVLNDIGDVIPEDYIEEIAYLEEKARFFDIVIKPKAACDIMLVARKGKYQSLMERSDIRIKRIPSVLAELVRSELEKRIEFDGIYFARRKDKRATQWQIKETKDPNFHDIVLRFHASSGLKELARHALGVTEPITYGDIEPKWKPVELGYAPFALAIGNKNDWKGAWPQGIRNHITHWTYNSLAREYAKNDVVYTRQLYHYFGDPQPGDIDSELTCAVACARWRGFNIDIDKIKTLRAEVKNKRGNTPTAPRQVKAYITEGMDETVQLALVEGTKAVILESIAGKEDKNWEDCWRLEDGTVHPAAIKAREVLQARRWDKEIELFNKLIRAGRFHASLKVIGALSGRMSGSDKLNPQGIKAKKYIRECFSLADSGFVLSGGDFVSFEIVIAIAVFGDKKLETDLLTVVTCPDCQGKGCKDCKYTGEVKKNLFGLFGESLFGVSYNEIMATKKTTTFYTDSKRGIYSQLYGGTEHTLMDRLGVSLEIAKQGSEDFEKRYPGVKAAKQDIFNRFCSMRQPGGIGSMVEWHTPDDYVESLLGYRRYFTLENKVCKALFDLAQSPPKNWRDIKIKVKRRDRLQTASGAVQSALYGAAFQIQASNMRAALNHRIQSTGAEITKTVQKRIWDLQPSGVHSWAVQVLNIHDEIHTVTRIKHIDNIEQVVNKTVDSFKDRVPLLAIDWVREENSWADKC